MYPPPAGPEITVDQARALDDTFLSSDPLAYFRSRIRSLVAWSESAGVGVSAREVGDQDRGSGLRARFASYLHPWNVDVDLRPVDVEAQVAADAMAIRHHAAEALLRFAAVRLHPDPLPEPACLWAAVSTGPRSIADVREMILAGSRAPEPGERFFRAVVPPADRERVATDDDAIAGANIYGEWLGYAASLLRPAAMDYHAAHNKAKHGLAVRARADVRMNFLFELPDEDLSTIPLSAMEESLEIINHPTLEFLARPGKVDGHAQGLELTQLQLDPAVLLTEAEMIAMAHAAMFHVAAAEHFAGRDDLEGERLAPPPHPGYPTGGPKPSDMRPDLVLGLRFPITTPPGGGEPARPCGIAFRNGSFISMTFGPHSSGVVADG